MAYRLEGRMLEACSCEAICPCWVGQDPDGGRCRGTIAWHFDKGEIDGLDVSGLTVAVGVDIPGNALQGNWRAVIFVDDKASSEQEQALLEVYTGKKGGPVADLVQLVGEVVGVERAPITFQIEKGNGRMEIGSSVVTEMEGFRSATGEPTALSDVVLPVIPGSPAYVGKANEFKLDNAALGINLTLEGHSAVQGYFVFEA